jgi:DNA polymerase III subunit chi
MADVGFYHLTRTTLTDALPRLLVRTLSAGQRALVAGTTQDGLNIISTALWAGEAWLPHGSQADGDADLQPIWLSLTADPVNGARYLFLVDGAGANDLSRFDRVFDLFDGTSDAQVVAARDRWRQRKAEDHILTYWQQGPSGWQKKAS